MFRKSLQSLAVSVLALGLAVPAFAEGGAGAYLAGRQAAMQNDFEAAANYFTRALARNPSKPELMEDAIVAQLAMGRIDRALPIAMSLEDRDLRSQAAHMVVIADILKREEFDTYLARNHETKGIGPLVDGLLNAWALIGAGQVTEGRDAFDAMGTERGLMGFAMYHKALALAMTGDLEASATLFDTRGDGTMVITRRAAMARAEILSQLGRNDDALISLQESFGLSRDPELTVVYERLEKGETLPLSYITNAREGLAEVFFTLAGALRNDAGAEYTLLYSRMARYLRPDHVDALLLNAELLEELGQFDLAVEAYNGVPDDFPAFHAAELGRAAAYRRADKPDAAIEVLEQLVKRFPELPAVHSTLGDIQRQQSNFEQAVGHYDRALELNNESTRNIWFLHYARAISHDRLDNWEQAEADFRNALELNPGQPQVLNYLGYSLVEKQIKLDEALGMIEQAVESNPDSGYIVDSLGWVLYRLGRYEEGVVHMERAVELMAVDPVVNDHLGDLYWAVGRFREAEFQWSRALSFVDEKDPGDADPDRIRRKLEVGLDLVLEEEGAEPLTVANDN
ncbi:MAG: tetratricopeptide repeat protein [Paracoccaceae bacterium]